MPVDNGIPYEALSGVVNAALPNIERELHETQKYTNYPATKHFVNGAEEVSPTGGVYGWNIRVRDAAGSNRSIDPYGTSTYKKNYYSERMQVRLINNVNEAFVFDRIELAMNRADPERLYDIIKEARSAQKETIANDIERWVWGISDSPSDYSTINGIEGWAGLSQDASGNFIANPEGSFDGVYVTHGDGTVTATRGNIDTSALNMTRLKNFVCTHGGVVNSDFLEQGVHLMNETAFEALEGLTGKTSGAEAPMIFWEPLFDDAYGAMLQKGSDDFFKGGKGDYYRGSMKTWNGIETKRVPALAGKVHRPVYFNKPTAGFEVIKGRGMWMIEGKGIVPGAHNVDYRPMDYTWSTRCRNLRNGIAVMHGAW